MIKINKIYKVNKHTSDQMFDERDIVATKNALRFNIRH